MDDFNTFLKFEKAKSLHGNEPSQIADYPDNVVETLRVFNKVWCPPPLMIPSKRQKSKYLQWIKELESLEDLCGTNTKFEDVLRTVTETYNQNRSRGFTFVVDTPLKLKNMIITELSAMNRKKAEESQPEPVVEITPDLERTSRNIKILKDMLSEEKE